MLSKSLEVFLKKTRRGKIRKLTREIYLREDVACGLIDCPSCRPHQTSIPIISVEEDILVLDANIILHQIDFLSQEKCLDNVVLPYTVLAEVRNRNLQTYARLRALCRQDKEEDGDTSMTSRRFAVFPNEYFRATHVTRAENESTNDRNDRAIRVTTGWLASHVKNCFGTSKKVILITQDANNLKFALAEGLEARTIYDHVALLQDKFPTASEKLAQLTIGELEEDVDVGTVPKRRAIYPPQLDGEALALGLRSGKFFQGVLRLNRTSCMEGSVVPAKTDNEIRIIGWENLNRAVDEDVVAVELVEAAAPSLDEFVEVEELDDLIDKEKKSKMKNNLPVVAKNLGRVVAIVKRNWRPYCGSLRPLDEHRLSGSSVHVKINRRFVPTDPRIPYIMIKTLCSTELDGKRLVVVMDGWDRFSRYPVGHWVEVLGPVDCKETESKVILREHQIITREFSDAVLRCLPPANWEIPVEEIARRVDLREKIVCSIDPPGCKDIDDALSVEELGGGRYRVGVHIADVTHFVLPGTAIDVEASVRCTTVYLVERRTDMLPGLLTTDLCSLVGGRDRLAFTAWWDMSSDAEVVDFGFHKSIIKSTAALSYLEAQNKINDKNDQSPLTRNLRILLDLSKKIRAKRFAKGALELASAEVRFNLDSVTSDPTSLAIYGMLDTNRLVEEFMLMANCSVAETISKAFPSHSVLRRHPPPKDDALEQLQKLLSRRGFTDFDYSSGLKLSNSLDKCVDPSEPFFNRLVRMMTTRCMNQATYFCSGEVEPSQFRHYGLAADLYTHFTSPIRRYADVLVHRLLTAAIGLSPLPEGLLAKDQIVEQCQLLSQRHRDAQFSGRASVEVYTYFFVKGEESRRGRIEARAVVIGVKRNGLLVIVPEFGFEGVVKMDPILYAFDEAIGTLSNGTDTFQTFDYIHIRLTTDEKDFRRRAVLELIGKSTTNEKIPTCAVPIPPVLSAEV